MQRVYHPGFASVVRTERAFLSDDPDTAVAETIAQMSAYVRADAGSDAIRGLAAKLRGRTDAETIERVWTWIRARVRFVPDATLAGYVSGASNIAEVLIRPVDIIRMADAQGDCDDFSMLGAALFRALSIPVAFCTVAADPGAPDQFSHVYLYVAGAPFDASHGGYRGWEAPNRFGKRLLWSVETGMPMLRGNLGGLGYTTPNWLQQIITSGAQVGMDIAKARYGVPPEGTIIQTPAGMISRTGYPSGFGLQVTSAPGGGGGLSTSTLLIGAGLLVGLVLLSKGRK